jgi:hypothetical protein
MWGWPGIRDSQPCGRQMDAEAQSPSKPTNGHYSVPLLNSRQQTIQNVAVRSMTLAAAPQQLPYTFAAPKPSFASGVPWDGCPNSMSTSGTVASAGAALLAKVRQTIGAGTRGIATTRKAAVQRGTYRSGVSAGTRKYVSPYSQRVLAQARAGITTGPE